MNKKEIWRREYDNPNKPDGSPKPNVYLGEFEITQTIHEDIYEGKWIGVKDGKSYLIEECERTGYNGGSIFIVTEIETN